jgi:hypothetical protein
VWLNHVPIFKIEAKVVKNHLRAGNLQICTVAPKTATQKDEM